MVYSTNKTINYRSRATYNDVSNLSMEINKFFLLSILQSNINIWAYFEGQGIYTSSILAPTTSKYIIVLFKGGRKNVTN